MFAPPTRLALAALAVVVAAPVAASAHIRLDLPAPRTLDQKAGPCGRVNSTRGTNVTVLAPGSTIEVRWTETINHPSHYRISFDVDGQDFVTPPTMMGSTMGMPNVILDLIAEPAGAERRQMITLPNVTCENCTLQLIQVMYDKPPYTTDALSDDIYFQCADIALRGPIDGDAGVDAPTGDTDAASGPDGGAGATELTGGCGCRTSQGQAGGMALAAIVLGIGTRRRRRA